MLEILTAYGFDVDVHLLHLGLNFLLYDLLLLTKLTLYPLWLWEIAIRIYCRVLSQSVVHHYQLLVVSALCYEPPCKEYFLLQLSKGVCDILGIPEGRLAVSHPANKETDVEVTLLFST